MYSNVVLGPGSRESSRRYSKTKKRGAAIELDTELSADDWRASSTLYKAKVEEELGKPFPQDPEEQLWGAIGAVFFRAG